MHFILFFLCIFFANPIYGETVKMVLNNLEKTYREIQDFESNFEQIEIHSLLKKKKKTSGTIYSLPKGKIFWHTKTAPSFKVISDGATIWLYYPKDNQLFTETWGNIDSQTKAALLFLRREGDLEKYFKIKWHNEKQKILDLRPKKSMTVEKIFLYLSYQKSSSPGLTGGSIPHKGNNSTDSRKIFLHKIKFFYPLSRTSELILKDIKFNQNLLEKHTQTPLDENITPTFQFLSSKNK